MAYALRLLAPRACLRQTAAAVDERVGPFIVGRRGVADRLAGVVNGRRARITSTQRANIRHHPSRVNKAVNVAIGQ